MPNKVKNLTWHACWNTMPTKASLVQRTIIEDPLCDCCHETPLHALWLCKEADTIWDDSELWSYRRQIQFLSFKELLSWIILQKNNANSSLSQRNHVCLKTLNQFATALHWIAQLSKDRYAEFLACQATPTATPSERPARIRKFWKAPPADMVKINFNRVVFFGENKSGIKVVIRDSSGSGIASCSKKILYAFSSCEVEALDAATDLSFVSEIGINKVVLEGDPLVAIKALIRPESPLSSIGPWIEVWRL